MRKYRIHKLLLAAAFGFGLVVGLNAQSTSQDFPTAIMSNEITGTIKARDLGDSRLTTYYYALNGDQGDLFINLVTRNFTGDIDVFTVNGLRPMTKIVVYADYGEVETGRAIYLRKAEKLLLRIQGRTPNDDEANFRLKFAGSFVAARPEDVQAGPEVPRVTAENRGGIRVNSVGTILPSPPKPEKPGAEKDPPATQTVAKTEQTGDARPSETEKEAAVAEETKPSPEVVVTDPIKAEESDRTPERRRDASASRRRSPVRARPVRKESEKPADETSAKGEKAVDEKADGDDSTSFRTLTSKRKSNPPKKRVEPQPDPLESINLVVQFKDGKTLEKRMSEVFKFSVDKGVLTVILKDGSITRYPIIDVAKVTIE